MHPAGPEDDVSDQTAQISFVVEVYRHATFTKTPAGRITITCAATRAGRMDALPRRADPKPGLDLPDLGLSGRLPR